MGNFDSVTTDGGSPQTRSANRQNEITSISGATTPTYDGNGNMTGDETGKLFVYDAWNRLVTVKSSGGTTLKTYAYDGLNRRASETASGTTTDLYYSAAWQVLTEKVGSGTTKRYVWSPVYVDAMVLRDRDTDANGSLDERLWVQQDANFNVTALVNGSGTVVERDGYDAFGVVTYMNASWSSLGSSAYSMSYGFQGRPLDDVSGNVDNRGRWYRPTLGRPITNDPIRYAAGDVNLYRWERNAPVNRLDPSGLLDSVSASCIRNPGLCAGLPGFAARVGYTGQLASRPAGAAYAGYAGSSSCAGGISAGAASGGGLGGAFAVGAVPAGLTAVAAYFFPHVSVDYDVGFGNPAYSYTPQSSSPGPNGPVWYPPAPFTAPPQQWYGTAGGGNMPPIRNDPPPAGGHHQHQCDKLRSDVYIGMVNFEALLVQYNALRQDLTNSGGPPSYALRLRAWELSLQLRNALNSINFNINQMRVQDCPRIPNPPTMPPLSPFPGW